MPQIIWYFAPARSGSGFSITESGNGTGGEAVCLD